MPGKTYVFPGFAPIAYKKQKILKKFQKGYCKTEKHRV